MRRLGVLAIVIGAFAVYAPASGGTVPTPPKNLHGCHPFNVPSHPWEQFLNGVEGATGTGWDLYWQGRGGSCKYSQGEASRIIDHGAVPARFSKDCDAEKEQTPGNLIEPFHTLTCHVKGPKKANYSFQAFVDPTSATPVPSQAS
jgi:hypothetical protein